MTDPDLTDALEGDEPSATPSSEEESTYSPPDVLPSPLPQESGTPFLAMLYGIGVACATGVALFIASRLLYIYILFNAIVGLAVGWAVAFAPKEGKYDNKAILLPATAAFSVLAYAAMHITFCLYVYVTNPELPRPAFSEWPLTFWEFLKVRAENETFIRGAKIGTIGNAIVWSIECLITFYYAWKSVSSQVNVFRFRRVPSELVTFVLYMFGIGKTKDQVCEEMADRGWSDPTDQKYALAAATAAKAIVSAASE